MYSVTKKRTLKKDYIFIVTFGGTYIVHADWIGWWVHFQAKINKHMKMNLYNEGNTVLSVYLCIILGQICSDFLQ